jgi:HEAT repeat protein
MTADEDRLTQAESLIATITQLEAQVAGKDTPSVALSQLVGMVRALGEIALERSIDALVVRLDSSIWCDDGPDYGDRYPVRDAAHEALVRIGEPAIDRLLTLLSNKKLRWDAVPILARIGGTRTSDQLLSALARATPGDWAFGAHIIRQLPRLSASPDESIRAIDIYIRDVKGYYHARKRDRERWEKDGRRGPQSEPIDGMSIGHHLAEAYRIRLEIEAARKNP